MTDSFTEDQSTVGSTEAPAIQTTKNRPNRYEDFIAEGQEYVDYFLYCERALNEKHEQWERWWSRYEGDTSNLEALMSREELEWRARVVVPWDYSGIQTIVAHMLDLIRSVVPPVQAQGVGVEDDQAAAIENLFAYTLRMNDFEGYCQDLITQACVQGVGYGKLIYAEESHVYNFRPTERDILLFTKALQDIQAKYKIQLGGKDALALNDLFVKIQQADPTMKIPPIPVGGPKEIFTFRGPKLVNVNGFDLFMDPTVRNIKDQDVIVHWQTVSRKWLEANAGPGKRFSRAALDAAPGSVRTEKLSDRTQKVLERRGTSTSGNQNPFNRDICVLYEVFAPGQKLPYAVLLNESAIPINNHVGEYQYEHGQHNFFAMQNVPSQFDGLGMSEYQRTMPMYEEADRIRSCHSDAVAQATYPAMKYRRGYGLDSGVKNPKPGRWYPFQDPQSDVMPLYSGIEKQIGAAVAHLQYVEQEIDGANGTYGTVRGAPATVGRVSLGESTGRMKATMTRIALRLGNFERGMNPSLIQMLSLWAQYGSDEALRNIAGGKNPLSAVRRDQLYEAIPQDYAFIFSAQSADPSMEIQQTGQILQMFGGMIQPPGMMELLSQLLSKLRVKNIEKITSMVPPPQEAMPPQPGEAEMGQADQEAEDDSARLDQAAEADGQEEAMAQEEVAQ